MTSKLIFFASLALLALANVHGEDDFKEIDNVEDERLNPEIEDDEEFEARQPRRLGGRFGGRIGRVGGSKVAGTRFKRFGGFNTVKSRNPPHRNLGWNVREGRFRVIQRLGNGFRPGHIVYRRSGNKGSSGGLRVIRRSGTGARSEWPKEQ